MVKHQTEPGLAPQQGRQRLLVPTDRKASAMVLRPPEHCLPAKLMGRHYLPGTTAQTASKMVKHQTEPDLAPQQGRQRRLVPTDRKASAMVLRPPERCLPARLMGRHYLPGTTAQTASKMVRHQTEPDLAPQQGRQ